jgi:hypothetical protein
MTKAAEVQQQAKLPTKGETCPDCGGAVFSSSQGKKCMGTCGRFLGGQKNGIDRTPRRTVNPGGLVGALMSRPGNANSTGRIA